MSGRGASEVLTELDNYQAHARVWEQVNALTLNTIQGAALYFGATGALWLVIVPNTLSLSTVAWSAALCLHVAFTYAATVILAGWANTIRQRLDFLQKLGGVYWPGIERLGKETERVRTPTIRAVTWVWPVLPVVGVLGTLLLLFYAKPSDPNTQECAGLLRNLELAQTTGQVEARKFALDQGRCKALPGAVE